MFNKQHWSHKIMGWLMVEGMMRNDSGVYGILKKGVHIFLGYISVWNSVILTPLFTGWRVAGKRTTWSFSRKEQIGDSFTVYFSYIIFASSHNI